MKVPKRAPPITPEYREMIKRLHEPLVIHPCPKCGSEMQKDDEHWYCQNPNCMNAYFAVTCHEEKVKP